jgi:hypothetical protein
MWIFGVKFDGKMYPLSSNVESVKMAHTVTIFALCMLLFPSCQTHFTQRINGVVIAVVLNIAKYERTQ